MSRPLRTCCVCKQALLPDERTSALVKGKRYWFCDHHAEAVRTTLNTAKTAGARVAGEYLRRKQPKVFAAGQALLSAYNVWKTP